MMRAAIAGVLAGANVLISVLLTRPALDERARLEERSREAATSLAGRESELARYRELARLVDEAGAAPEDFELLFPATLAPVRKALLEAEQGLGLRRLRLELRPQARSDPPGVDVGLGLRGDFASIYLYLDRLARIPAFRLSSLLLAEERSVPEAPLVLTLDLFALTAEAP